MRSPELLRERNFRRFYVGQAVSLLGDQVSILAIPLAAVVTLHAGARQLGLLTAVGVVPSLLFSMAAGSWVDRRARRRRVMLVADAVRGAAMLSLPVAYALGHLTLGHLYAVAFVVGCFDVFFFVAYNALIIALVRPSQYLAANSLLNGTRAGAQVIGSSLGGALVALITAPAALLIDGLSFCGSAFALASVRAAEPPVGQLVAGGLAAGGRWIIHNPLVRRALLASAVVNLFAFVGNAILVLYASRTLRLGPGLIGAAFGAGAIGGVLGATACRRVERRVGLGRTLAVAAVLYPVSTALFPVASGNRVVVVALLVLGELLSSIGVIWLDISLATVFAQQIPDPVRARVAGAYRTVNYGVRPVGALLGGVLGSAAGLRGAMWIAAAGATCGGLMMCRPVVLRLRSTATDLEPAAHRGMPAA